MGYDVDEAPSLKRMKMEIKKMLIPHTSIETTPFFLISGPNYLLW